MKRLKPEPTNTDGMKHIATIQGPAAKAIMDALESGGTIAYTISNKKATHYPLAHRIFYEPTVKVWVDDETEAE